MNEIKHLYEACEIAVEWLKCDQDELRYRTKPVQSTVGGIIHLIMLALERRPEQPERMFPLADGPAIPWSFIEPYGRIAARQHCGQTLERLAERGGLSVAEVLAILEGDGKFDAYWQRRGWDAMRATSLNIEHLQRLVNGDPLRRIVLAKELARFVIDHPNAGYGRGDQEHADRCKMQALAERVLG